MIKKFYNYILPKKEKEAICFGDLLQTLLIPPGCNVKIKMFKKKNIKFFCPYKRDFINYVNSNKIFHFDIFLCVIEYESSFFF